MNYINKRNLFIKILLIYFMYFFITNYGGIIFSGLGIKSNITISFLNDLIFLVIIVFIYRNNIKKDFIEILKLKKTRVVLTVIVSFLLSWIFPIIIAGIIYQTMGLTFVSLNTEKLSSLAKVSPFYYAFKILIIAAIAEQLLFREAIRECVNNKWAFIIISSIIVTAMNYVFIVSEVVFNIEFVFSLLIIYFIPALIYSIIYIQNKSNIVLMMMICALANSVPLVFELIL